MSKRGTNPRTVQVIAAIGVAAVVLPLVALAARAPWRDIALLGEPGARTALLVSAEVSLAAAALAFVLGTPVALVLARGSFPGRSIVRGIALLPLVLPPVVAGVGLLAAFGRLGLLGRGLAAIGIRLPFTTAGAVLASAFVATPLLILTVEAGVRALDPQAEEAAETLGASRWYVLRRVTLPAIAPQIAAGIVVAWARALGEFGATITFAGNVRGRTQTLPLAVFEAMQTDPGAAILMSLLLVALSLIALIALRGRFFAR
ncbi:MAG TPA: ABC transporter permease [Actinomycetota bacterium]|nr:ABC transporter permease [Actinomycetota bacterium]